MKTKEYKGEFAFNSPVKMEISIHDDGSGYVFWEIEELKISESIDLWFDGNELTDYYGVFDLPKQLVEHLIEQGYDMSYVED